MSENLIQFPQALYYMFRHHYHHQQHYSRIIIAILKFNQLFSKKHMLILCLTSKMIYLLHAMYIMYIRNTYVCRFCVAAYFLPFFLWYMYLPNRFLVLPQKEHIFLKKKSECDFNEISTCAILKIILFYCIHKEICIML